MKESVLNSPLAHRRQAHWRENRRLTWLLLSVWLLSTLAVVYWPSTWDVTVWGWPLGFWLAAQGLLLLYLALVWIYDLVMARVDKRWGLGQPGDEA